MSGSDPSSIIATLAGFTGPDLTRKLSSIESSVRGLQASDSVAFIEQAGAGRDVLHAAAELKRLAGQINVTIHALGILLCLPHILEPGEVVESASLGAGNTGRKFDLETNYRVAEFKFINWRGGAESIRQNGVFKDYVMLADHQTNKRKQLYLSGTEQALRFLNGGRALASVLSKDNKGRERFFERHGDRFRTVGQYFAENSGAVAIVDVSPWLSELAKGLIADESEE